MYKAIVRRRIRASFAAVARGDATAALAGLDERVHHVFAGDHPLGGERHSREAVARWFERLHRLFELRIDVSRVSVSGPPWRMVVSVEWRAHVQPRRGEPYINDGAHVIEITRGRVTYFHAYEDSQRVAEACRQMAEAGIEEAAAPPITD